jgi:dihydroorotate dehydrogenase (fumarate)
MLADIQALRSALGDTSGDISRIGVEINTSCPNIQGHPPPSYEPESLLPLLEVIASHLTFEPSLAVGLKLPPYIYSAQFENVIEVLTQLPDLHLASGKRRHPIAFLTCTNTLGSCVLFASQTTETQSPNGFALPTAFGGLAGDSIHALSLGLVGA